MKIIELVEVVNRNKAKLQKPEQLQEFLKKNLNVKEYMSIKDKKALVEDITNECFYYDGGVFKFDEIEKYVYFTMKTIEAYTDLELSDDIEEDYDTLNSSKLLGVIIGLFKGEYDDVSTLLQMKSDYVLSSNSIEAQFGKFFDGILNKLDVLVNALSDKVGSFNLSDLPIGQEDLQKILKFADMYKK